jgi:hypothetical protein
MAPTLMVGKQCITSRVYQHVRNMQNLYIKGNNVPTIHVQYKIIHVRPNQKKKTFLLFLAQIHES